jgi:hypothetical protein
MKFDLTTKENLAMFRRAWRDAGAVPGLGIEDSAKLWLERFGCHMTYGKSGFVEAEFENEKQAVEFLLRWL